MAFPALTLKKLNRLEMLTRKLELGRDQSLNSEASMKPESSWLPSKTKEKENDWPEPEMLDSV